MITFRQGDIFQDDSEALVNPVNCVGAMGKGLALEFKRKFPDNFREYARECRNGRMKPGRMSVFKTYRHEAPHYIINFPTKRDWRNPSRMEDIRAGVQALAQEIRNRGIKSIAIPALGSGLGQLPWEQVRKAIKEGLGELEDVRVTVYEPQGRRGAGK